MAAPVADASQGAKGACQPGYAKLPLLVKKIHELLEPRPKWSSLPIVLNCFAGAQLYARGIRPEAAKLLDRNATLTKQYQEEGCDEAEMLRRKLLTRVEEEGLSDIEKNDKDEVFMRISMELRKEHIKAALSVPNAPLRKITELIDTYFPKLPRDYAKLKENLRMNGMLFIRVMSDDDVEIARLHRTKAMRWHAAAEDAERAGLKRPNSRDKPNHHDNNDMSYYARRILEVSDETLEDLRTLFARWPGAAELYDHHDSRGISSSSPAQESRVEQSHAGPSRSRSDRSSDQHPNVADGVETSPYSSPPTHSHTDRRESSHRATSAKGERRASAGYPRHGPQQVKASTHTPTPSASTSKQKQRYRPFDDSELIRQPKKRSRPSSGANQ